MSSPRSGIRLPTGGLGPGAVVVLLLVGLVAAMAVEPTRRLLEQREHMSVMARQLQDVERANAGLEARIERLSDPDFVEQQAREQIGLVKPGETTYVVMTPPQRKRSRGQPAPRPRPAARQKGFVDGVFDFVGIR